MAIIKFEQTLGEYSAQFRSDNPGVLSELSVLKAAFPVGVLLASTTRVAAQPLEPRINDLLDLRVAGGDLYSLNADMTGQGLRRDIRFSNTFGTNPWERNAQIRSGILYQADASSGIPTPPLEGSWAYRKVTVLFNSLSAGFSLTDIRQTQHQSGIRTYVTRTVSRDNSESATIKIITPSNLGSHEFTAGLERERVAGRKLTTTHIGVDGHRVMAQRANGQSVTSPQDVTGKYPLIAAEIISQFTRLTVPDLQHPDTVDKYARGLVHAAGPFSHPNDVAIEVDRLRNEAQPLLSGKNTPLLDRITDFLIRS